MDMTSHVCGGTMLIDGGSGPQAHQYCDRCGAFTRDMEADQLPDGTDAAANQRAWDYGCEQSPAEATPADEREV